MKDANGNYQTKVIAVDGNASGTTNKDNAGRVFDLSANYSAIYGVANQTTSVKNGKVNMRDVLSIAFLGSTATYYDLKWTGVQTSVGVTYGNVLNRTIPANRGMRYVVGGAGSSKCSAMVNSMKVQYWTRGGGVWTSEDADAVPNIQLRTNDGTASARLGILDGAETRAIQDQLFLAKTDDQGNTVYRYFDSLRTGILTLEGAAINTSYSAILRFDNAIANNVYNNLVATYGNKVQIGMLVVETALLGDRTTFTKADLDNAGIAYKNLKSTVLCRDTDYTVLSSSFVVNADHYGTSYTAIGYLTVTLDDGTVKTYMSPESTARSVVDVATAALDDVVAERNDVYKHATVDGETYSRYDANMQKKLRGYLGL